MGFLDKAKAAVEQGAAKAKDAAEDVQQKRDLSSDVHRARQDDVRADRERRDLASAARRARGEDSRAEGKDRRRGRGPRRRHRRHEQRRVRRLAAAGDAQLGRGTAEPGSALVPRRRRNLVRDLQLLETAYSPLTGTYNSLT